MTHATFEIRHHFGTARAYPTNAAASDLCNLTGSRTLLPQTLPVIERLGFLCVDASGAAIVAADLY